MRTRLIAAVLVVMALLPTSCTTATVADAGSDDISAAADRIASEKQFNGLILVADAQGKRFEKGYGYAVFEPVRRSSSDTRYQTGSFSKWVASVVVLSLVDRGALDLNAPIGRYLPDYNGPGKSKVTLHHLLSHISGVPNDIVAALKNDPVLAAYASIDPDLAVEKFASGALLFEPGQRFDYSHSNWLLVRAIIEHVSGQSYAENVTSVLLKPLGLKNSGIMPADFEDMQNAAKGYVALDPVPQLAARERSGPIPDLMAAIGGFYATGEDLVALLNGVYRGPILSDESRARLWNVITAEEGYAYGGRVRDVARATGVERASWNNNSNGPYKSLMVHTHSGTTIILLNNTQMKGDDLAEIARALLVADPR